MIPDTYDHLFQAAAAKYLPADLDWRVLKAQAWQESTFRPDAVSPAGAQGLMQIMPTTWQLWHKKAGLDRTASPFEPADSITVGACYLAHLWNTWDSPRPELDRLCLALASYNAGLGNLLKAQRRADMAAEYADIAEKLPQVTGRRSLETLNYVPSILKHWMGLVAPQEAEA